MLMELSETELYYYGARYYNPSVSTWLSVDPWADKYPHVTPYNFVEGNPVMLIDPTGNGPENPDLDVATNPNSSNDILSIVSPKHRDRVIIDNKTGSVSLNLVGLSEKEITNDKGLAQIRDMVDSGKKFYYESGEISYTGKGLKEMALDENGVMNASNNGRDSNGGYTEVPQSGYDGQVSISSDGKFTDLNTGDDVRKSVIYHELRENYYRTHHGFDYKGNQTNNGFGADWRAVKDEGNFYGNFQPGGATFHRPIRSRSQNIIIKANKHV